MADKNSREKTVALNRRASHDDFLEDRYECGMVLTGTEIKSIRDGKVQFKDSYISIYNGEAWIKGMHISPYKYGNVFNVKKEIQKMVGKIAQKGYTIVPVEVYFKGSLVKVQVALAKGKNLYDKREDSKLRDAKREMEKALKLR